MPKFRIPVTSQNNLADSRSIVSFGHNLEINKTSVCILIKTNDFIFNVVQHGKLSPNIQC